jgi:hypothetical protein
MEPISEPQKWPRKVLLLSRADTKYEKVPPQPLAGHPSGGFDGIRPVARTAGIGGKCSSPTIRMPSLLCLRANGCLAQQGTCRYSARPAAEVFQELLLRQWTVVALLLVPVILRSCLHLSSRRRGYSG